MAVKEFLNLFGVVAVAALLAACNQAPSTPPSPSMPAPPDVAAASAAKVNTYFVKGIIKELKPEQKTVVIKHEEIPAYMRAMTMPFRVQDAADLNGLVPGQTVSFRLNVTDDSSWIDQITVLGGAKTTETPTVESFRRVRDVEPLRAGDLMPDYRFTNQLGQSVSLGDFEGQAVALTFIFTRCPLPDFCPRMSGNFASAYRQLLNHAGSPTNWHLFSISFDVGFDTPAVLKNHSDRYEPDPARWSFCTGAMIDIDAITEQFGLNFSRPQGQLNWDHNLRTVVIDAQGRVQTILIGNTWKPEELVGEIVKAAKAK
jgi:protein SCO1/2